MTKLSTIRRTIGTAALAAGLVITGLVGAPGAQAHGQRHDHARSLGTTTVTTAPGIASTLLKARVVPLPVLPQTRFGVSFRQGLQVSYGFPITGSNADLDSGTGDITHSGGIKFVSRSASLEIGKFDIDLAAGKIYAAEFNSAPARIPVLDLDLSGLQVGMSHGDTVLSGIGVNLDPAAAEALNSTFGLNLPADGSLAFGSAKVLIKG